MATALVVKFSPIEAITSSVYRTLGLVKGLKMCGYDVTILTVPMIRNLTVGKSFSFMDDVSVITTKEATAYKHINDININPKGSLLRSIIKSLIRYLWKRFSVFDYSITLANTIDVSSLDKPYYDLVISSSDPKTSHIVVKNLIRKGLKYGKWIQYWGDPFTYDITNKTIYPKIVLRAIEKSIIKKANCIIYVSPLTLEMQKQLFPKYAEKFSWLPIPYIEEKRYERSECNNFTIAYIGGYNSKTRIIGPFYQAAKELSADVLTYIVGDSDIILEPTKNVRIIPRSDANKYEKNADIIVCILNHSGTQIPGKIYHSAATSKAILVVIDGERGDDIQKYLSRFNRYLFCHNDTKSIKKAIEDYKSNPQHYEPVADFRCDVIAKAFLREASVK